MKSPLKIAIVGPGRLASALAPALKAAGYPLSEIVSRNSGSSRRSAKTLAAKVGASATTLEHAVWDADLVWLCVPDRAIAEVAEKIQEATRWKGKMVFHASGALPSSELAPLRRKGAQVASVHPFMTFVGKRAGLMQGVPFGVEGDKPTIQAAGRIVRRLGGRAFAVSRKNKALYHAWGAFASPLLVALITATERVAGAAGVPAKQARKLMQPIIRQTLENYLSLGPEAAFTGPIARGDADTVKRHVEALRSKAGERAVYTALARFAMKELPARNKKGLLSALRG